MQRRGRGGPGDAELRGLHRRIRRAVDDHLRLRCVAAAEVHEQDSEPLRRREPGEARAQLAATEIPGSEDLPRSPGAAFIARADDADGAAAGKSVDPDAGCRPAERSARSLDEDGIRCAGRAVEIGELYAVRGEDERGAPGDLDARVSRGRAHVPGPHRSAAGDGREQADAEAHLDRSTTAPRLAPNKKPEEKLAVRPMRVEPTCPHLRANQLKSFGIHRLPSSRVGTVAGVSSAAVRVAQ